jgi:hypothetical protein
MVKCDENQCSNTPFPTVGMNALESSKARDIKFEHFWIYNTKDKAIFFKAPFIEISHLMIFAFNYHFFE